MLLYWGHPARKPRGLNAQYTDIASKRVVVRVVAPKGSAWSANRLRASVLLEGAAIQADFKPETVVNAARLPSRC